MDILLISVHDVIEKRVFKWLLKEPNLKFIHSIITASLHHVEFRKRELEIERPAWIIFVLDKSGNSREVRTRISKFHIKRV